MDLGHAIAYQTLKRGSEVFARDGERVGVVQRVSADGGTHIFDGLVIDTKLGPGGLKFVDAPEIEGLYERGVVLALSAAEVDALPKP